MGPTRYLIPETHTIFLPLTLALLTTSTLLFPAKAYATGATSGDGGPIGVYAGLPSDTSWSEDLSNLFYYSDSLFADPASTYCEDLLSHECIVARAIMFGEALRELIAQHPDAACINLGCGLDDKFSQVDNGIIEWFDVDLPDQIELRRHFFQDQPRCTMVCGDALDGTWTAGVPKDRMAIICMEGVLEYFTKEQTATCLHTLCDSFEHGYLVAEMNSMAMVEHARKHGSTLGDGEAPFKWGTASGQEFVELEPRMRLLSEHSYSEEIRKHSERGRIFADSPYRDLNNRIAVFSW